MTLQSSGTITMAQINSEFSLGNNLNSYRGTTWWKDDASTGTFSSGAINFSDFYSTRVSAPGYPGNDSYTKLLLHFDNSWTDSSASNRSTATNTASLSSAQSKFGGYSSYFNSTNITYADSDDWDFGAGDFTIDCWIRKDATGSWKYICGQANSSGSLFPFHFSILSTNLMFFSASSNGSSAAFTMSGTTAISANTWYHVCVVRNGNTWKMFLNGTQEATTTSSITLYNSAQSFGVGSNGAYTVNKWIGYIDEFRVSKGIARWTSNFTPPTLAYI